MSTIDSSQPSAGSATNEPSTGYREPGSESDSSVNDDVELLIVGTFGGGGVNQYIDQQASRLEDRLSVSTYAMGMPPSGSGVLWMLRGLLLGVAAMVRFPWRRSPDIVHIHTSHQFSFYRSSFYILYARYVWDVPIILHVHGSSFDEFVESASSPVALFQTATFSACDEVIVLSGFWEDVLAERVDQSKITVLPNAVDISAYQASFDADPPRIVFISNLIERKGVGELVDAIDRLLSRTEKPVAVDVAGDGPLSRRVEQLAAEFESVTYHGYVSESEKRDLLRDGSVFVLPTHAEGLPIALLEGMAAGNAIVSTPVGAIPEVIDDDAGVLVPPGAEVELADALESLLVSPERRAAMARENRRRVEEQYTWTQTIAELLQIYRRRLAK